MSDFWGVLLHSTIILNMQLQVRARHKLRHFWSTSHFSNQSHVSLWSGSVCGRETQPISTITKKYLLSKVSRDGYPTQRWCSSLPLRSRPRQQWHSRHWSPRSHVRLRRARRWRLPSLIAATPSRQLPSLSATLAVDPPGRRRRRGCQVVTKWRHIAHFVVDAPLCDVALDFCKNPCCVAQDRRRQCLCLWLTVVAAAVGE